MKGNIYIATDCCSHCGRHTKKIHIGKFGKDGVFYFRAYEDLLSDKRFDRFSKVVANLDSWEAWKIFINFLGANLEIVLSKTSRINFKISRADLIKEIEAAPKYREVIFTGKGTKGFCYTDKEGYFFYTCDFK